MPTRVGWLALGGAVAVLGTLALAVGRNPRDRAARWRLRHDRRRRLGLRGALGAPDDGEQLDIIEHARREGARIRAGRGDADTGQQTRFVVTRDAFEPRSYDAAEQAWLDTQARFSAYPASARDAFIEAYERGEAVTQARADAEFAQRSKLTGDVVAAWLRDGSRKRASSHGSMVDEQKVLVALREIGAAPGINEIDPSVVIEWAERPNADVGDLQSIYNAIGDLDGIETCDDCCDDMVSMDHRCDDCCDGYIYVDGGAAAAERDVIHWIESTARREQAFKQYFGVDEAALATAKETGIAEGVEIGRHKKRLAKWLAELRFDERSRARAAKRQAQMDAAGKRDRAKLDAQMKRAAAASAARKKIEPALFGRYA